MTSPTSLTTVLRLLIRRRSTATVTARAMPAIYHATTALKTGTSRIPIAAALAGRPAPPAKAAAGLKTARVKYVQHQPASLVAVATEPPTATTVRATWTAAVPFAQAAPSARVAS